MVTFCKTFEIMTELAVDNMNMDIETVKIT